MTTMIIKNTEITRPATTPLTSSVLDHVQAAGNFHENAPHFGLRNNEGLWNSYNCLDLLTPTPTCPDPINDFTKTFDFAVWTPAFEFAVHGGVQCNPVGLDEVDQKSEVARVFGLSEGKGVERALLANRFVANLPLQFLAPPVMSAATTAATGGTLAAGTYGAVVTAQNAEGETVASNRVTVTTTGATSTATFSWSNVVGETGYRLYVTSGAAGSETFLAALGPDVLSYTWTGTPAPGAGAPPAANTAALPDKRGVWDAPVDLTPASPVTLKVAVALLEGYAASLYAGVPTIHMPRAAISLISDMVKWHDDGLAYTPAGSKIAVGGGYDDAAMLISGVWDLYATGEVYVEATEVVSVQSYVVPGDGSGTGVGQNGLVDNTVVTLAERQYRVAVDCFVAHISATIF